jgi:hypothetical protein
MEEVPEQLPDIVRPNFIKAPAVPIFMLNKLVKIKESSFQPW